MLTDKFIDQASGLARLYTDRNLAIQAKPNTVIDRINATLRSEGKDRSMLVSPDETKGLDAETIYNLLKDELKACTTTTLVELSVDPKAENLYAAIFEHHFKEQKEKLDDLLYVAYNHALPLVKELYEETVSGIENNTLGTARAFNVDIAETPVVFSNFAFREQLESYKDIRVAQAEVIAPARADMGPISDEDLLDAAKTGIREIDNVLSDYLASRQNKLREIYDEVFTDLSFLNSPEFNAGTVIAERMSVDSSRVFNNMLIFILAKSFFTELPEGMVVRDLRRTKSNLVFLREQAGRQLYNEMRVIEAKREQDALVMEYINKDYTVRVFDQKYDEFIKQGGSPEVLFGALLSQNRPYTLSALISKKDEYLATYRKDVALLELSDVNNRTRYQRRIASEIFIQQLKESVGSLDEAVSPEVIETMKLRFTETYDGLSKEEHQDFLLASIKLISRTRFANTDIEKFLTDYHALSTKYPDFEARDIGALVMVEYIGRWLGSMLTLRRMA